MKIDEHILVQLDIYRSSNDFDQRNKSLADNIKTTKEKFISLLNEEQRNALHEYTYALYLYDYAEKNEFFCDGFLMGYFSRELNLDIEI